jgi:NitT/TauT family transport system substrate-binding protein
MQRQARAKQLELFVKAYNQACDSINKYGVAHYRDLIKKRCKLKEELVDSLPKDLKFRHAQGPRQEDVERVEAYLRVR